MVQGLKGKRSILRLTALKTAIQSDSYSMVFFATQAQFSFLENQPVMVLVYSGVLTKVKGGQTVSENFAAMFMAVSNLSPIGID